MAKSSTSGQGRPKGVPNKATAEIKSAAQAYGSAAIVRLAELGGLVEGKPKAESETAQATAIRELLDRGFGKPSQVLEHTDPQGNNPFMPLLEMIAANGRPRPGN